MDGTASIYFIINVIKSIAYVIRNIIKTGIIIVYKNYIMKILFDFYIVGVSYSTVKGEFLYSRYYTIALKSGID